MPRRDYGSGSIYQLADGRWRGAIDAGYTKTGGRRRVTVTAKTQAEVKRRLRDKVKALEAGESVVSPNITVKAWADQWLPIKQSKLAPKGYAALSGPVRKWIVPTIGHRRISQLTPADVRAVEHAQRAAGLKGTTCAATQRALFNMLRAATAEGLPVPQRVLLAPMPSTGKSDRLPLTAVESLAVLAAARDLPHWTRWAVALLHGMRQGECLGLTWDAIDFTNEQVVVEWQLQRLPYTDKHDRSKGFAVPDEYEARRVHKAWHLVRPKSKAGFRVYPLLPGIADALYAWREVAPDNPLGLVWPEPDGKPRWHQRDLAEWHALQQKAGVTHPTGRPYHVHECRNVTATELNRAGVDASTMKALIGHSDEATTRGYISTDMAAKRGALEKIATVFGLD